jgi:hypothetical protein
VLYLRGWYGEIKQKLAMTKKLGHFELHLVEAMAINSQRQEFYRQKTQGKSKWLSWLLIWSERMTLALARYFDKTARPFNERGIAVVEADFVSMSDIKRVETAPIYQGVATAAQRKQVLTWLKQLQKQARPALKQGAYQQIADLTAHALRQLHDYEKQTACHYAMTIHLLESLGFAALHAVQYLEQDKQVVTLCYRLVAIQVLLLTGGVFYDRLAQPCHAKGVGILLNDVPVIPFLAEYHSLKSHPSTPVVDHSGLLN